MVSAAFKIVTSLTDQRGSFILFKSIISQAFRFYIEKIIIPIHFETSFRSCIPGSLIKLYLFSWKFYLKRTTALIMSVTASEGNKLIRLNPSKIMDVLAGSLVEKLPRFKNVIIVLG